MAPQDESRNEPPRDPNDLEGVIDGVLDRTSDQDQVSTADVLDAFSHRLFGPLLVAPALILISPIGAIPGAPAVIAVLIVLIAGQRLLGMPRPWLPAALADRSVDRDKLERALGKIRPWAARVDRLIRPRLTVLAEGPATYAAAAAAVVLAAAIVPIGFVPFAVLLPGGAVLALGLALTAKDGALALIGYALAAGTVVLTAWVL